MQEKIQTSRNVLNLGAGVNDAPALAQAAIDNALPDVLAPGRSSNRVRHLCGYQRPSGVRVAAIWPTPILNEGNVMALDIKSVASPNPGADFTVVIQI